MNASLPKVTIPQLTPGERQGLQAYWKVYETHREAVNVKLMEMASRHPEIKFIMQNRPAASAEEQAAGLELQRRAILDNDWEPYLESLQVQGMKYAEGGLSFKSWFDLTGAFRTQMVPYLLDTYGESPQDLLSAIDGMGCLLDIAMSTIGSSYLETKQQSLREQGASLHESEQKFSIMFEKAPFAAALSKMPDGVIININGEFERMFGYTRQEAMGRTSLELGIHPDAEGRARILAEIQARGAAHNVEQVLHTKSGEPRVFSLNIDMVVIGGEKYALQTAQDITERKEAEEKLRRLNEGLEQRVAERTQRLEGANQELEEANRQLQQTEKRFRGLLEFAPDAMVVVDEKGIIHLTNSQAEKMFGYTGAELIGQSVEALVPKRFGRKHVKHREEYYTEHPARPMGNGLELYGLRKNGTEFPVEISLSPLESDEGLLVSAAIRDVTQRKQIEEEIRQLNEDLAQRAGQLQAANRELESFSYSVSHDLRAPLRSIDGFSQAVLEDFGEQLPLEGREHLERVRGAAQRMAILIDDLLNLSRITRAPLQQKFLNLSAIAQEAAESLRESQPERQVEVSITPDLMVDGDPHLLRIALENLLSNAWKFTSRQEHPRIEFGQQHRHNHRPRTFYVRDNGVGFDMAYVDKLFGVFQRLHSVSEYPGTGVGLATVQRIINIHGGRVWAESKEGEGTTFYFTLSDRGE